MTVRAKTKFRLLILLASVALLIGAAATVYGVRKRHTRQLYAARRVLGMTQYKNGDFVDAVVILGPVIRREEYAQDAEAIYAFAESRKRVETPDGKYLRDAMTMLQRVLSIQPERADVKSELLDLYTQLGYNFEAVELAKKLLDKNPRDLEALRAKARGLAASQKSDEALAVCKEFNAIAPLDLEMRILSLEVLRDLRRRPQILDQVQDLLAKYPNDGKVELIAAFAFTLVEEIPETQRQQLTELLKTRYPAQEPLRILDPFHFSQFFAMQASQRDLSDLVFVRYLIDQLDTTRLVAN